MQKYTKLFDISRKIASIALCFIAFTMLTGCTKKSDEIILDPVEETTAEISEAVNAASSESFGEDITLSGSSESSKPEDMTIYVHVCGAVVNEGVYELCKGSRVIDAVNAAGGFDVDADTTYVNQAAEIADGLKIRIPYKYETDSAVAGDSFEVMSQGISPEINALSESDTSGGKININLADEDKLCQLPGIGKGYARKIIDYREQNGSFNVIEDIMKVSGIKDKLFSRIRDMITV
ncbi:MAG: helix-hairpin-helix domain-containing protein [Butyrivibrio sp.]|nr:helix-hairpin-helix domain-containing protein [Butyrivibrio sp.]